MPIYEYTCKSCQSHFERLVKSMSAGDGVKCPQCGSAKTERTLSVFAVGAESAKGSPAMPEACQRCGGRGPCAME